MKRLKSSTLRVAIYLTFVTLGVALMLTGVGWLTQLGCAVILSVQIITRRFSRGQVFMTAVGCSIVLLALVNGIRELKVALRYRHLWLGFPPPWWWAIFILTAWIGVVISEVRKRMARQGAV